MEHLDVDFLVEDVAYSKTSSTGDTLVRILAEEYHLMYASQAAHWNVMGPNFPQYHALFEESYGAVGGFIDALAEQIRFLGTLVPETLASLLAAGEDVAISSTLVAADPTNEQTAAMFVSGLRERHAALKLKWNGVVLASKDAGLNDLASRIAGIHAKMEWKLRVTAAG